jgi:DNA-binding MarR family transcriptional regulator
MNKRTHTDPGSGSTALTGEPVEAVGWLVQVLPRIMRRLIDSENLDMPLLQLPLAQLRLAQALYKEPQEAQVAVTSDTIAGETMGQLSERLGVRHNALTQAADRLINHGLAERASDPRDRRVVRLRLTEKGTTWVQARRERRRAHLATLWAQLDFDERSQFLHAVRTLEAIGRRLEPPTAIQGTTAIPPATQTVEETLTRFVAGADTLQTTATAGTVADRIVSTT